MRRSLTVMVGIGFFVLTFLVGIVMRDLEHKTWMEYTPGNIDRLAVAVELFREEQGVLPKKLSDLQTIPNLHDKEYLIRLVDGTSGNQFRYRVERDGFVITVTKAGGIFLKKEEMEKFFKTGAAIGGEGKTTTVIQTEVTNRAHTVKP